MQATVGGSDPGVLVSIYGEFAPMAANLIKLGYLWTQVLAKKAAMEASRKVALTATHSLVLGGTGSVGGAATVAAANSWNLLGWTLGTALVGAHQDTPHSVTWGCYKPIIGDVSSEASETKPITLAALAAHPQVQKVSIECISPTSLLPLVRVVNLAGEHYILQGVQLPWGDIGYHAERVDDE
jgi:hypothetical protein